MSRSGHSADSASLTEFPDAGWGCGSFGAIAEFAWDPGEAISFVDDGAVGAATARGAIRIELGDGIRPIAYELGGREPESWQQGLSLCLREADAAMTRRTVVTELGPDRDAVRPQDRTAILFDLGLGTFQAEVCVRSEDPDTIARLRGVVGQAFLTPVGVALPELSRLSPHRVFCCRFGRIEVFAPIPPPEGKSPNGPHTHVLPRLLVLRQTHAANVPLPDGWIPCMTLFPPNPIRTISGARKPFDYAQFEAFQSLWRRYGEPELVALKAAALTALLAGSEPEPLDEATATRAARSVIGVAVRQAAHLVRSATARSGHASS
jgi:hypothetical protein